MTDIEDIKRERRTTRLWLMDMLSRGRDPIKSLRGQLIREAETMLEYETKLNRAIDELILAAVPEDSDSPTTAKLKRKFLRQAKVFNNGNR